MDLAFTPEEQAFREEIRAWVHASLPADISHKVHNALRLSRDDMQRWAKILGKKGWLGHGWPKEFGGPGWNAVQKHLFEEECALAGAPRVVPFGPVMVAPVIMAFGNAEQQKRFLPGIASGDVWWSQGYSEPGSGSDLASVKCRAERQGDKYIVNGQKVWISTAQVANKILLLARTTALEEVKTPTQGLSLFYTDFDKKRVAVHDIEKMGRTVTPGDFMSISKKEMPVCGLPSVLVRTRQKIHSLYWPSVVQVFWPLTMYLLPCRSARHLTEARSEPEPGSL